MKDLEKQISQVVGKEYELEKSSEGRIIKTDKEKYFLSKRDPDLSDKSAIEKITGYGISPIMLIGEDYILQRYVDFSKTSALRIEEMSYLLRQIHSNKGKGGLLVHGDFSRHNTCKLEKVPRCYDYEFTHFGDPFIDLGRIILRELSGPEDIEKFFKVYSNGYLPSTERLKEGLSLFCDWQYLLRKRKNQPHQEVPLKRKEKIIKSSKKDFLDIINNFKTL